MTSRSPAPLLLDYEHGCVDKSNARAVATITLNDPDRRNALGDEMFSALESALLDVQKNCAGSPTHAKSDIKDKTRVVVLCARGPAFCSGFDLRAVANDPDKSQPVLSGSLHRLHRCVGILSQLTATTIAVVSGAALAGGCALVSACDFVIATEGASFGYPTHLLGLSPSISGPTLASRMGLGASRELLLGGQVINGARAYELGFASHLVSTRLPSDKTGRGLQQAGDIPVFEETSTLIRGLLAKDPRALLATKCWLQELDSLSTPKHRASALLASESGVGGDECVGRVAAAWKPRT